MDIEKDKLLMYTWWLSKLAIFDYLIRKSTLLFPHRRCECTNNTVVQSFDTLGRLGTAFGSRGQTKPRGSSE